MVSNIIRPVYQLCSVIPSGYVLSYLMPNRHTAVVVHGEEFFYGGVGITNCPPVRKTAASLFMTL